MWNVHLVDDCIDSTHISSEGSKEATTKARAQGPMSSTASVRPPIKSSWNPDQIDKYICPTDIHHSNQKPSSTCMLCTTSHTFVYNQCPQLKNLTGTCQRHHHCVINTLKSRDFLHELQVLGVAPRDDTTIYPDICQWQKIIASLLLDIVYIDFLLHFFLSKVLLLNTLRFRQIKWPGCRWYLQHPHSHIIYRKGHSHTNAKQVKLMTLA